MKGFKGATPDEYVDALSGWRHALVSGIRSAVLSAAEFEETIKWGHLVYLSNGPVLLIRAEEERVLFGFRRGQRLRHIEPRLKTGGKYEMARLELREGDSVDEAIVRRLASAARALNHQHGDPRDAAKPGST